MKSGKLLVAGISYIFISLIALPILFGYGVFNLILGIILLSNSFFNVEELQNKKGLILILALISIITNLFAAVLLFVVYDDISLCKNKAPPKDNVDQSSKRIDLLLKIGVGMIFASGLLLATTNWQIMTNLMKLIGLVGMGIIFLLLANFSEKKLKIKSTKAYYILGLAFLLLSVIGICYFKALGEWFSYFGDGKNLAYAVTILVACLISMLIYRKFSDRQYLYFSYIGSYLILYNILRFINLDMVTIVVIFSFISLIIELISGNKIKDLKDVNSSFTYIYLFVICSKYFDISMGKLLIFSVVTLINQLLILKESKDKNGEVDNLLNIGVIIISYLLIVLNTYKLNIEINKSIIYFVIISVLTLIISLNKKLTNEKIIFYNKMIYNLSSFCLIIVFLNLAEIYFLLFSLLYFVVNVVNILTNKEKDNFDLKIQPFIILLVVKSMINFVNANIYLIKQDLVSLSITIIIYFILYIFSKNKVIKEYYKKWFVGLLIVNFIFNLFTDFSMLAGIINFVFAGYLAYSTYEKEDISKKTMYYVFFLANIVVNLYVFNVFSFSKIINSIILLLILGMLTIVLNESLRKINYLAIVIPIYNLINVDFDYSIKLIIDSLFALYILGIIVALFVKDKENKDVISLIGLILILGNILTYDDMIDDIFLGIITIVLIVLTINKEEYKKVYYCSVVFLIIDVISGLSSYWVLIPFWMYLFVIGVFIVCFVTNKEIKKSKNINTNTNVNINANTNTMNQNMVINGQNNNQLNQSNMGINQNNVNMINQNNIQNNTRQNNNIQNNIGQNITNQNNNGQYRQTQFYRFCPNCGLENKKGRFCINCGYNLEKK